jgi:hypothetical protein
MEGKGLNWKVLQKSHLYRLDRMKRPAEDALVSIKAGFQYYPSLVLPSIPK